MRMQFTKYYKKHKALFEEIIAMCENAEDADQVIEELSGGNTGICT